MAANIELKYFNTFWLKKMKNITKVLPGAQENPTTPLAVQGVTAAGIQVQSNTLLIPDNVINVGQKVTISYINLGTPVVFNSYITEIVSATVFKTKDILQSLPPTGTPIVFGKIINFDQIPQAYSLVQESDWLIE